MKSFNQLVFGLFMLLLVQFSFIGCGQKNSKPAIKTDSIPAELQPISQQILANPSNPDLYFQRAQKYIDRKDGPKAFQDINKAIELKPDNSKYYVTQSDVFLMLGQVKRCREALEKAISLNSEETDAYLKLAELAIYFKDYNNVQMNAGKALDIDKINPKAWFIKGYAYKESGDTAKAIKSFQTAVEQNQQYYDAYIQLGLLFAAKKNKLAADYYNSALNINPKSIEALYNLGMFYQESEAFNEAMDQYRKIIQIDPKYKFAHFNLGYIHMYYLRVYRVAVKHFSDAIDSDPKYVEAWYNRGYCYELMGDPLNARDDYNKALELRPGYSMPAAGLKRIDKADEQMKH